MSNVKPKKRVFKFHDLYFKENGAHYRKYLPSYVRTALPKIGKKKYGKEFLSILNCDLPKTYCLGLPPRRVMEVCADMEEVVIKPDEGKNSWGVFGLKKIGNHRWYNIQEDKEYSTDSIVDLMSAVSDQGNVSPTWMAEELLIPPNGAYRPVEDIKIYAFYGQIALVLHKENIVRGGSNDAKYRWYNSHWTEVKTGKYERKRSDILAPPPDYCAYNSIAKRVSSYILKPFYRIDILNTNRGPMVGELTPWPGHPKGFSPEVSIDLASMWFRAQHRLIHDVSFELVDEQLNAYKKLNQLLLNNDESVGKC
ncbi:ATP-grasp fold amidoligase family protein [Aquibaculum arenosum]|uniref:ATP-grasp fold amidoligase family protein n=1 Tax=Aquibaculum arenosum TaxID=3032591 RepID=A0ABT5YJP8_9PROT|nr:ATP-grasp fold amidoligase family protein [Fodinicurvata sp. CAU 1616]MDF2094479.1 ATP-grasp fold amidoligase family protein [Fodinicurvata sp. CAU 1616]